MRQITAISRIDVEIEGRPIAQSEAQALGEVHVRQRLSAPAQCELVFFDPPEHFDNARAMAPGAPLRVVARDQELFSGQVTAVDYVYGSESRRELRGRAYDPLHRLGKRQPARARVQFTLAGLPPEILPHFAPSV